MSLFEHRISWVYDDIEYFAILQCENHAKILEQGVSVHPNQKELPKTIPKKQLPKQKEGCSGCGKDATPEQLAKRNAVGLSRLVRGAAGSKDATPEQLAKRNAVGLSRLVRGAAGMLKAELGIGSASKEVVAMRKEQCNDCKHYDFGVCTNCGCFCAAKVLLKSEKCPIRKW